MILTKIEIENYKSIKSSITVPFSESLPTVLIGKNGSGKTNILEALAAIAMANSNYMGIREQCNPRYRAYVQLTEADVASMLPDAVYNKDQCEMIAYSSTDNLKIDRVRSEYIVPSLKKEITGIRDLARELEKSVNLYEKQLIKIFHKGDDELPIGCYQLIKLNGGLTNYNTIRLRADLFIKSARETLERMLKTFDDDDTAITFVANNYSCFIYDQVEHFRLEYVEPTLAKFEEKFITINSTAIKREITKINKATKDACDNINRLIDKMKERTARIVNGLDIDNLIPKEQNGSYYTFLRHVQHIFGQRCLFLKNESRDIIFRKEDRDYYYNEHSTAILETYLRHVYQGNDKAKLLKEFNSKISLSEQAVAEFEDFLNKNIPDFDREMYESISVKAEGEGHISIFLNEKSGEQIALNETSAGRRWYFTYYFMKNILSEGDIFVIDEPAAMLHPSAQKEVLQDLMELTKRGVKVVYSTHSPYLIPKEYQCVQFVTMTDEGTKVSDTASDQELLNQISEIVGEDIFDIQTIVDRYIKGGKIKIAKKCYDALRHQRKPLEDVARDLAISVDTIKSWGRTAHNKSPKLENVILVSKYTKVDIKDLLR